MSNLKQIGLATMMYVQDYDERFPGQFGRKPAEDWPVMLLPYSKNVQIYRCPSTTDFWHHMSVEGQWVTYGFNCWYLGLSSMARLEHAAGTVMSADSNGDNRIGPDHAIREANVSGCPVCLVARHNEMMNATFGDGHAKAMKLEEIEADEKAWFDPSVF